MLLLFSRNVGLKTWRKIGNLSREIYLYNKLIERNVFSKIFFFTYKYEDKKLSKELKEKKIISDNIYIFCPPIKINNNILNSIFCFFYFIIIFNKIKEEIRIIKTNQIDGSYIAAFIKIIFKKKFYLRSGYNILKRDKVLKFNFLKKKFNFLQFIFSIKYADIISVSNNFEKKYYSICFKKKTYLIYNYINTKIFYNYRQKRNNKFLYIGRISSEKNIKTIIDIFNKNPKYNLDLFGQKKIGVNNNFNFNFNLGKNINFFEAIPNEEIPKLLNEYSYLILPSNFEGLSKTIIEGMSCGIFCIVSDLIENKFLIKKEINGYILNFKCNISIGDIVNAEKKLQGYRKFNENFINNYFTFERYFKSETEILKKII